jgi:hypothetical protein
MGFSNQERINLNSKILAASVVDASESSQWYESRLLNEFTVGGDRVLTQLNEVRQFPATTLADARSYTSAYLTGVVEDLSQNANAVRLTAVPGAVGTYIALETYGDFSSDRLVNWIQPQAVPTLTGAASTGYAVALYNGQPGSGGVLVATTAGTTGSGSTKTVGWIFNYSNGLLLLSADYRTSITDPWILGFRYIGATANDGYSSGSLNAPGVLQDGYIAIADNQDLTYLQGTNVGDVLTWNGSSWVSSAATGGQDWGKYYSISPVVITAAETWQTMATIPISSFISDGYAIATLGFEFVVIDGYTQTIGMPFPGAGTLFRYDAVSHVLTNTDDQLTSTSAVAWSKNLIEADSAFSYKLTISGTDIILAGFGSIYGIRTVQGRIWIGCPFEL